MKCGTYNLLLVLAATFASTGNALTVSEGKAIGAKAIASMTETLASGSMTKMADELFADELEWIWSGPQNGKGKKEALVEEFAGSWGAMVSAFNPATPYIVVDTPVGCRCLHAPTIYLLALRPPPP